MAESRTVVVVLNGSNYITWKIGSSGSQAAGSRRLCGRFRMLDQKNVSFCESCTSNPFPSDSGERTKELLELVHSDVLVLRARLL